MMNMVEVRWKVDGIGQHSTVGFGIGSVDPLVSSTRVLVTLKQH